MLIAPCSVREGRDCNLVTLNFIYHSLRLDNKFSICYNTYIETNAESVMITVYFDSRLDMWAIDVDDKIYTFAFTEKAANKIASQLKV
jgi:hypothetical protein